MDQQACLNNVLGLLSIRLSSEGFDDHGADWEIKNLAIALRGC